MSVLSRHLLRSNLFLMGVCLLAGVLIYMLIDLFDRLDDFVEAGLGLGTILEYMAVKIPLILSQILPGVFLVSVVVQLSTMARNRELVALRSGGVSYRRLIRFFVLYSLIWCVAQLAFSQYLGVAGEKRAYRIWREDVRGKDIDNRTLEHVWFRDGDNVIKLDSVQPASEQGCGFSLYALTPDGEAITSIIRAVSFNATGADWNLGSVRELDPQGFEVTRADARIIRIDQDLRAFAAVDPKASPAQLPLWTLGGVIDRLEASGSNVEHLRTAWHAKLAYAFSIAAMAMVALAVCTLGSNVYRNVATGVAVAFVYYGVFVVTTTAGQKGLLTPMTGAWAANAGTLALTGAWLAWKGR